jgi:hypothetical protein
MFRSKLLASSLAIMAVAGAGLPAQAALTTIGGTEVGDAVRYVIETDQLGPFGMPMAETIRNGGNGDGGGAGGGGTGGVGGAGADGGTVTGSRLVFNPSVFGFDAEAGLGIGAGTWQGSNGNGNGNGTGATAGAGMNGGSFGLVDRERGGFRVRIEAARDYVITGIGWAEDGFYATQGQNARAGAYAFLKARDPATGELLFRDAPNAAFTGDSADSWDLTSDQTVGDDTSQLNLTVKNILAASATPGDWSWIEKEFANLRVDVAYRPGTNPGGFPSPIPIPASIWLLGSALVSLVTIGRRRAGA